ncbi:MAG: isoprenylcysteine carboxylmethyltransferase family protein [Acidobacteriota bacterium]
MTHDLEYRIYIAVLLITIKLARWLQHRGESVPPASPDGPDRTDALVALLFVLVTEGILLGYLLLPRSFMWASLDWGPGLRRLGLVPGLGAVMLCVAAHRSLGPDFNVFLQLRKNHRFITTGPFRYLRHPIYAAGLWMAAAIFLLSANWLVGGVRGGGAILFFTWRIRREEAMMCSWIGAPYRHYMATTGRFFPKVL